jgi:alpha-methylacyl-CoA racemase
MNRLGFGFDAVRAINPMLIYCSITGYGQSGISSALAGHDINYQAASGLLDQSLNPAVEGALPPPLVADIAGGAYPAVINILLALRLRDRTGIGSHLDISMADGTLPFAWYALAQGDALPVPARQYPHGGEGFLTGSSPRYGLYKTKDARFLAVGALEDKFWRLFCAAIDLAPHLHEDRICGEQTKAAITTIIGNHSSSYWRAIFAPLDCCCTVVATLDEALADPHFVSRRLRERYALTPDGSSLPSAPIPLAPVFRETAPETAIVQRADMLKSE